MFVEVLQSDLGMLVIGQDRKIVLLFKMTTRQIPIQLTQYFEEIKMKKTGRKREP